MNSTIKAKEFTYMQRMVAKVVKCGPIPRHIAIIMDGNRRYAKIFAKDVKEGYREGINQYYGVMEWCKLMGVKEISFYAFSIENFKRTEDQVNFLLDFITMNADCIRRERLNKDGIWQALQGDIPMLPVKTQVAWARLSYDSKDNNELRVNNCFAYTSRNDLANVANGLKSGVMSKELEPEDINVELVDESHGIGFSSRSEPDIYIRTSGEVRLSDYLTWQSAHSMLHNIRVNWPDFSPWHLLGAIVKYQMEYNVLQVARDAFHATLGIYESQLEREGAQKRRKRFIESKKREAMDQWEAIMREGYHFRKSIPPYEDE